MRSYCPVKGQPRISTLQSCLANMQIMADVWHHMGFHCVAQELYECLVRGGRLAEQLYEAVSDWLGAARAVPRFSSPSPSACSPLPYQRLAQRVLLLLSDDDLLDFAVRLLPRPSTCKRGQAGAVCNEAPAHQACALPCLLGCHVLRSTSYSMRIVWYIELQCGRGKFRAKCEAGCAKVASAPHVFWLMHSGQQA